MVGADQLFARKLVDVRGQPLGQPPGIDKDDGGPVLLDQLENPRVNRGPDAPTRPLLDFPAALGEGQGGGHSRGRSTLPAAARLADSVGEGQAWSFPLESAHVFDGDFDGDLHGLDPPGVDDGDVPIRSTQEAGSLAQRPLGCRETDPLWLSLCERHQPLEAQCQVRASLCVGHRVNLVDDHPANGGQDLARRTREEQEERLRRGDQDVRGMPFDLPPVSRRRVAGPDRDRDRREFEVHPLRLHCDAPQRCLQVALDVHRERLERRDVQHAAAFSVRRHGLAGQPVDAPEECRQGLATAGRRRHQRVAAGRNRFPTALLDLSWRLERARKPGAGGRRKQIDRGGHGPQFIARSRSSEILCL